MKQSRREFDESIQYFERALEASQDSAAAAYRTVIGARPEAVASCRNLGRLLFRAGKGNEAISVYREGLSAMGNTLDLATELGFMHERLGQIDAAIAQYEAALEHNARNLNAANNLAMLRVTAREDEQSIERAKSLI